ncbi:MAG: hypothetical protein KatS3mg102_0128 [Planctomycetota bacterium]|nr:MAG: hypothetical protein KatS3mg102_0128 [Planctomycetota bacterium]
MKDPLWSAVYELLQDFERLLDSFEVGGFGGAASGAVPMLGEPGPRPAPREAKAELGLRRAFVDVDRLVTLRHELRGRLDQLKTRLAERLTERESYLVLFPLVIFIDETVHKRFLAGSDVQWPPLQKELFQIDNGGEAFYEVLDDLLRKPDTFPFVYEIYYLCLSDGFRGRYHDNPSKIAEYKSQLESKIPRPRPEGRAGEEQAGPPLGQRRLPVWNYAVAAALVLVVFATLRLLGTAMAS